MSKEIESKEIEYGSLTLPEIKKRLKGRGAKRLYGRKEELVKRLKDYDKNNNFGYESIGDKDSVLETPDPVNYKDINATSPLPSFTKYHLDAFLQMYEVKVDKATKMYEEGWLQYIRFCQDAGKYFVKCSCKAELRKHITL